MTQPLSGESSVLGTDLISDGFFWISTKEEAKSKEQRAGRDRSCESDRNRHAHQIRASRWVVRRRMVFCERSWLARIKRTVRLFARIKIEWVMAVAPWDRTPRKSALSLMPVAQKTMFFPLARSSAE